MQKTGRMYYGWKIVGVTFLTQFIGVGFIFYSYGVFFKALAADFSGSRLSVSVGLAVMSAMTGLVSPFLGRMLDYGSIRAIMCTGGLLMMIGFLLASRITSLWQLYVILGVVLGPGAAMLGSLSSSTLVANWFIKHRGMALGTSTMGISLSGVIMAPAATALIAGLGWRNTFVVYAAVTFVVIVPSVLMVVVNRPEDMGLEPDGDTPPEAPQPARHAAIGVKTNVEWSTLGTLSQRNFWAISMTIAFNFLANGALLTHIIPHATDLGFTATRAAYILSTIASLGVVGKLLFGWISDRIDKRLALWIAISLQSVGMFFIIHVTSYPMLMLAGGIFGLGMGGIVPIWGTLLGSTFGRLSYGRVMGLMSPVMVPVHILGVPFAGWAYDTWGSYERAFWIFLVSYGVAAVSLAFLRIPAVEPGRRA